jgi:2',3'-cyclic-nucleotide 2'-phosphodiesterase (5'-nucleotidase family)
MNCQSCIDLIRLLLLASLISCATPKSRPVPVVEKQYLVLADSLGAHDGLEELVKPYRDSMQAAIKRPIVYNQHLLKKQLPESGLGNLLADILLERSRLIFGELDMAMLNYGGIRAALPAGEIQIGHLMEVLPFQNYVSVVEMEGELLLEFFHHWASKGGTPMSGTRYCIVEGKATQVVLNGFPLRKDMKYRVVMPDYVAKGGDGCGFLEQALSQEHSSILLFDLVLEALTEMGNRADTLNYKLDGRICIQ